MADAPTPKRKKGGGTTQTTEAAGEQRRREQQATIGALALVLSLRMLYLFRFGDDQVWMNLVYWEEARSILFSHPPFVRGAPLTALLFIWLHGLGLELQTALWVLYLLGHAVITVAIVGVTRELAIDPGRRLRLSWSAAVLLAVLFPWALDHGFRNIAVTIAAAAMCWLVAVGRPLLRSERLRVLPTASLLAALFVAAGTRSEAAFGAGLLCLLAALRGPRWGPRARALGLVGMAALVASLALFAWLRAGWFGTFGLNTPQYAYYTFLDGVPHLICWIQGGDCSSEYARYRFAATLYGTAAEHGSSIARAVLAHPLLSIGWGLAKIPEMIYRVLLAPRAFGVLPLGLALFGLRVHRRRHEQDASRPALRPLWAFVAPLPVLFVPPPYAEYFLVPFAALLVLAALGSEDLLAPLGERWPQPLAVVATLGAAFVLLWGYPGKTNSPVLPQAAAWLETNCPGGCLVNALPPQIRSRTWRDIDFQAPLPRFREIPIDLRTAANPKQRFSAALRVRCSFAARVARAQAMAEPPPIFHVQVELRSFTPFSPFDSHRACERPEDAARPQGWTVIKTIRYADDIVTISKP